MNHPFGHPLRQSPRQRYIGISVAVQFYTER